MKKTDKDTDGKNSRHSFRISSFQASSAGQQSTESEPVNLQTLRAEIEVDGEDEQLQVPKEESVYVSGPYLCFGQTEQPGWLNTAGAYQYLCGLQFDKSSLHRARIAISHFDSGSSYDPAAPGVHYCDFCGIQLQPGAYDVLDDGRERCSDCGKDAIRYAWQFKKLFKETLHEMETIFGITFREKIKAHMVNAKKVNHDTGFIPTPQFDPRTVGYAQPKGDKGINCIYMENGAPRWNIKTTIVHEMTHIWQFENWSDQEKQEWFSSPAIDLVAHEGMAVWAEIQYLVSLGELDKAIRYKRARELTDDEYGLGMKLYLAEYGIFEQPDTVRKKTPFNSVPPLQAISKLAVTSTEEIPSDAGSENSVNEQKVELGEDIESLQSVQSEN